jgi:hypothetical protein
MEYETAGDPMSGLKWTRKTTEKISAELNAAGICVGKTTVGNLLKKLNFSLKSNSKKISNGGKSISQEEQAARDSQFSYINTKRKACLRRDIPVISVDAKKKELIGNFKNAGTRYRRMADLTNDHDFNSYAQGKALPYGIYDQGRNEGFVFVGRALWDGKKFCSSDTPEFAVDSIDRWLKNKCIMTYADAGELLILADAGGSNGCRSTVWKTRIQENICNRYGLRVTVCHYPPGASKWNPIEHRLFSEISKNWAGTPLRDYETVVKYIRSTKTKTGLKVNAQLIKKRYKTGLKASKEELKNLNIRLHPINPDWNYTIFPNN